MISELSKVYDDLNKGLFEAQLPHPIFRIDLTSKEALRYRGNQSRKISIGVGFISIPANRIPDALLHVMVHIFNFGKNVEDCSPNQYHKRSFLQVALDKGFSVVKTSTRGWGTTTSFRADWLDKDLNIKHPTPAKAARLRRLYTTIKIDLDVLQGFQEELKMKLAESKPKRRFLLKYSCGCLPPHNCIRSGRRPDGPHQLDITCNLCGQKFVAE